MAVPMKLMVNQAIPSRTKAATIDRVNAASLLAVATQSATDTNMSAGRASTEAPISVNRDTASSAMPTRNSRPAIKNLKIVLPDDNPVGFSDRSSCFQTAPNFAPQRGQDETSGWIGRPKEQCEQYGIPSGYFEV